MVKMFSLILSGLFHLRFCLMDVDAGINDGRPR